MFRAYCLFALLVITGCQAPPPESGRDTAARGVGRMDADNPDNTRKGSAFLVAPEIGVTALHVIGGSIGTDIELPNGRDRPVDSVLAIDEPNDLALVRIRDSGLPVLPLARHLPEIGSHVMAVGIPDDSARTTGGVVMSINKAKIIRIETTAPLGKGFSGGALIDDEGNVVGVLISLDDHDARADYAAPAGAIADLLERVGQVH